MLQTHNTKVEVSEYLDSPAYRSDSSSAENSLTESEAQAVVVQRTRKKRPVRTQPQ